MCVCKYNMEIKKPKCEECGSGQVYFRLSTNELVCRLCGNIQEIKKTKKEKK